MLAYYKTASMRRLFSTAVSASDVAKVILVGSGRMGNIRAELAYANPRLALCGIVDVNMEGAIGLASRFGTKAFSSLEHAISDLGYPVDGIIVSSPTFSHEEVITQASHYGISVFTEKPVDETAAKIENLFEIARSAGISLCCGFQRRFDRSYVAVVDAIRQGVIGTPVAGNIIFADHPCPPKEFLLTGGNIFMDLSAHDVDFVMHALDDDVATVYATGTSSSEDLAAAGVHDNATMMLQFQRGAVVTIFMSRSATYGYDQRCEIFGGKGLVSLGNEFVHATTVSNQDGVHLSKLKHSFPQRFHQAFGNELDAFADNLLCGIPWPVTAQQCVRVQRVADAARISCERGIVVDVRRPPFPS